ncbi:2-hydroxyacid dehydrogenase (plasmid) [Ketogulonicigenium robustum]|uniref:2-hydroxyacid dehydrogenase n=1 Tax=Ketogulonicigenium robustum TaxID=92947 RepID=A0A1W6P331_9RHOB|nr:2-hydroxyacid dehydrogenase [Ketogulonicigenium robustum]ARO15886.1 2-hydroxyacid dehydrogenase [Ketogulonicigenium robustum]
MSPPASEKLGDDLAARFNVIRWWEAEDKPALLAKLAGHLQLIATTGHSGPDADVIAALPKLQLIASFGVGYDGIDIAAARQHGVKVTNTPDVLNDCVAELALGLMIALARDMVNADQYTRAGRWARDGNYPFQDELTGKVVGILGLGRIGKEIARRAQAFRMQVVYHGRSAQVDEPYRYYPDLVQMARDVDWLVVIAPSAAGTHHLVDAAVLDALGRDGRLINVARGSLVDEAALVAALQNGTIKGAGLDVFEDEPRPNPALLTLSNVILSPHAGTATHRTRRIMGDLVMANLEAHLRGDPLRSPVV